MLAGDHVERERQHAEYAEAQRWVDKVLEGEATLSNAEFAAAATMLGRALIGQARSAATPSKARVAISECREQLRAKAYRLLHSKEVVEVWLVQGQGWQKGQEEEGEKVIQVLSHFHCYRVREFVPKGI